MTTKDSILDASESLIQERGYHGFSFADVAARVGIRKASIYYHFPAKADLGQAVVSRYRDTMRAERAGWDKPEELDVVAALRSYMAPIVELGRAPGQSCLCGVLGGEYHSLPETVQAEISSFFDEHIRTLADLIRIGQDQQVFRTETDARILSKIAFSMIEGSMLIKRTQNDGDVFDAVIDNLHGLLGIAD